MDFTTNGECGLLIEGHEHPPIILCPWRHPYYQRLLEQELGMEKALDLFMWRLDVRDREKVHPAIWETAEKLEAEHGIVCRNFRKKDLQAEVGHFVELYNSAWERNWGFVPLTEEEVRHYAKDLAARPLDNVPMMIHGLTRVERPRPQTRSTVVSGRCAGAQPSSS